MKSNFDKLARRNPLVYKKGDKVVITTWQKAVVVEKASEPRSYWVKKESNNKIVRRNLNNSAQCVSELQATLLTVFSRDVNFNGSTEQRINRQRNNGSTVKGATVKRIQVPSIGVSSTVYRGKNGRVNLFLFIPSFYLC